jgi:hypothetical protein
MWAIFTVRSVQLAERGGQILFVQEPTPPLPTLASNESETFAQESGGILNALDTRW